MGLNSKSGTISSSFIPQSGHSSVDLYRPSPTTPKAGSAQFITSLTMRDQFLSFVLATAVALLLPSGAHAARPCDSTDGGTFQYPLGDVRYDGPDPAQDNNLSTIAATLRGSTGTPLYECVGQWPEAWAGWYEGGSSPIWADCIYTGAGLGPDNTVSFAVDWKTKTMYLAHGFTCSDQEG
jgi:hypothetical protein